MLGLALAALATRTLSILNPVFRSDPQHPYTESPMSSAPRQDSSPDLDVCEREPIHIPGSIEPHGALLVVHEPDLNIIQVSGNTGNLLGVPCEALLTMSLAHVFEPQSLKASNRGFFPRILMPSNGT